MHRRVTIATIFSGDGGDHYEELSPPWRNY